MKILFVSTAPLEYNASSNMRNIALLKGLIENGHDISTLTPEVQKDSILYDEKICNINVSKKYFIKMGNFHSSVTIKNNEKSNYKSKIKKFLYNKIKKFKIYDFRSLMAKQKIFIDKNFDIIISSSDPKSSHLMAKQVMKCNPNIAKKWIQYWGDPFYDDINDSRKILKIFVKKEEKRLLKLCDKVVYVSPLTLKKQQKLFPQYSKKMFFLPIPYNEEIIYKKQKSEILKIGYFGNYFEKNRNIIPLYNSVNNKKKMKLLICGETNLNLKETSNVVIKNREKLEKIREYESEVDVLVCVCNKFGTQIPGKIYHYSATNKPILVILDGQYKEEIKKYLEKFKRFILCYNDKESIEMALNKIDINKLIIPCKKLSAYVIAKEFINE